MANIADANVHIEAKHCASEVQKWLEAVDKKAYYDICCDHDGYARTDLGENSRDFVGSANGRWTYQTNIEQALSPNKNDRLNWCAAPEAEEAYQELVAKLAQDHEAELLVEYEEAEPGVGFVGHGSVHLFCNGEEVATESDYGSEDLTIDSLISYGFADSEPDALEYMGIEEE